MGSVFVSFRAALPADGFEKNTIAQFLSTSESPPPISHPSSFCLFPALSFCSLTCFLKALWWMWMGVSQWHRLINASYLPMAWTQQRGRIPPQSSPVFCLPFGFEETKGGAGTFLNLFNLYCSVCLIRQSPRENSPLLRTGLSSSPTFKGNRTSSWGQPSSCPSQSRSLVCGGCQRSHHVNLEIPS